MFVPYSASQPIILIEFGSTRKCRRVWTWSNNLQPDWYQVRSPEVSGWRLKGLRKELWLACLEALRAYGHRIGRKGSFKEEKQRISCQRG